MTRGNQLFNSDGAISTRAMRDKRTRTCFLRRTVPRPASCESAVRKKVADSVLPAPLSPEMTTDWSVVRSIMLR